MKFNKDTINFLVVFCVFLWNVYDFFDCICQGNCGWRSETYISEFGFTRLMGSIPNLFFGFLLLGWLLLSIKDINTKKNILIKNTVSFLDMERKKI
ncbi:hypothetical protein [Neisseria dentiae]|uniref:hypothetical protein n=1 Tax=Neisseria dentiae TaxID=194197 RepID=UPI0035A0C4C9